VLNLPDAADLLTTARETLLKVLLPDLPPEKRYDALMVANAMAIAAREAAQAEAIRRAECAELEAFYQDDAPRLDDPSEDRLLVLSRRLAQDARAGRFDAAGEHRLRALLERQVEARLRVSNPKYLGNSRP
jgi:Domain of unknown function (DUF6285)